MNINLDKYTKRVAIVREALLEAQENLLKTKSDLIGKPLTDSDKLVLAILEGEVRAYKLTLQDLLDL